MHKPSQDNISAQAEEQLRQRQPSPAAEVGQSQNKRNGLISAYAGKQSIQQKNNGVLNRDSDINDPDPDPLRDRRLPRPRIGQLPKLQSPLQHPSQAAAPEAQPFVPVIDELPTIPQRTSTNPPSQGKHWSYVPNDNPPPIDRTGRPFQQSTPPSYQNDGPNTGRNQQHGNRQSIPIGGGVNGRPANHYPSAGPTPPGKKTTRLHLPIYSRILIAVVAFFIVSGGGVFAYYQINYAGSVNDITGQAAIRKNANANITNADPLTQRTNIVLLGSDTDGKGNDPNAGQPLAQTIIIITIDPKTNYAGMLSIPRDMQVTDPAYQYEYPGGKIDEVFQQGWQGNTEQEKARAAAGHIMDVIQNNYGIPINYYAWVGLAGFIKVIDDLGGVDIDATHPMTDDNYPDDTGNGATNKYGYMRLYIPPGPQHLDGQQALDYVRTRHADLGGDFGRTARQQQVLSQIKVKMTNTDTITEAPQLLQALDGYLMTDLTLSQLASLAQVAKNVDINKLHEVSFGSSQYATQLPNPVGRGNYSPNCPAVETTIQQMFGVTPNCIPQDLPTGFNNNTISTSMSSAIVRAQPVITAKTATAATMMSSTTNQSQMRIAPSTTNLTTSPIRTTGVNNLMQLMLLVVSGSFNAIQ